MYNSDSGLDLANARPYDPISGRFLSRDPMDEIGDPYGNLYMYAAGNPLSYIDPTGLFCWPWYVPPYDPAMGPPTPDQMRAMGITTPDQQNHLTNNFNKTVGIGLAVGVPAMALGAAAAAGAEAVAPAAAVAGMLRALLPTAEETILPDTVSRPPFEELQETEPSPPTWPQSPTEQGPPPGGRSPK